MRYVIFDTKFGFCGILTSQGRILRTSLPVTDRKSAENDLLDSLQGVKFDPDLLPNIQNQIKSYFSGTYVEFNENIQLQIDGLSQFSQEILKVCRKIPYGRTATYAKIAKMANHPKAARAVGNAMGNNPIPLIIPCHRVVKSDSTTGGFQRNRPGGSDLKKRMLELEFNSSPKL